MVFRKKKRIEVSEEPEAWVDEAGERPWEAPENPDFINFDTEEEMKDYVAQQQSNIRTFATGADRDTDEGKPDFPGLLSWEVLGRYGEYMTEHSIRKDGTRRSADNWKKSMPKEEYLKSLFRHTIQAWALLDEVNKDTDGVCYEAEHELEEALCAVIFNASGLLFERLNGR